MHHENSICSSSSIMKSEDNILKSLSEERSPDIAKSGVYGRML
jgi:hypothetical protein